MSEKANRRAWPAVSAGFGASEARNKIKTSSNKRGDGAPSSMFSSETQ